ncbi:unnamed protein product [Caenorhabditis sp. 36 PRJEB53466]|nr:unnamed protein product [Caenorhabditis sp. 36 PRJEB53466]
MSAGITEGRRFGYIAFSIDPEEAVFSTSGAGKTDHMMVNFTKTRLAVKARCSNNEMFRVNPVFQIIEPCKCKNISITRNPGPPLKKSDKVMIVYHSCDEKVTDEKAFIKEMETKNSEGLKFVKVSIRTDGKKKEILNE